jgi:hypothetical protein
MKIPSLQVITASINCLRHIVYNFFGSSRTWTQGLEIDRQVPAVLESHLHTILGQARWLKCVIPATWEAETEKIMVQGSLSKK